MKRLMELEICYYRSNMFYTILRSGKAARSEVYTTLKALYHEAIGEALMELENDNTISDI